MSGPIKPSEVEQTFPEEVYQAFNELIQENMRSGVARIMQHDVAGRIAHKMNISTAEVHRRGLLDVEASYSKAGWVVSYDKPGYNESYQAFFVFNK